jgi:histidinol-phosphate aminotransferase
MSFIKPGLANVPIYTPGKSIDSVRRQYQLDRIYKLASNENPLGASETVNTVLKDALNSLYRYPDAGGIALRSKLAEMHNRNIDNILLGNGSAELIDLICRAFVNAGDEVLTSEYSFEKYYISTLLMEGKPVHAKMENFTYDLRAMAEHITAKTKVIFIANPNNPTGTYVSADQLTAFIDLVPPGVIVVLDEAYYEYARQYADYPDGLNFNQKNIIVLRTFSKAYGLAGLRMGYLLAPAALARQIAHTREAFNTNALGQLAALTALDDQAHIAQSIELNEAEKQRLYDAYEQMNIHYYPSATNFILIKVNPNGKALGDKLLEKGIIVRPLANYGLNHHIRVSIGLPQENDFFISALKAVYQ